MIHPVAKLLRKTSADLFKTNVRGAHFLEQDMGVFDAPVRKRRRAGSTSN